MKNIIISPIFRYPSKIKKDFDIVLINKLRFFTFSKRKGIIPVNAGS